MMRTGLLLTAYVAVHVGAPPAPLLAQGGPKDTALEVASLRTEYKENPLGIDTRKPRLSWQLQSSARGVAQSAYQVRVSRSERSLRAGRDLVWDSGRVASDESIHRPYDGPPLQSGQRYYWQVHVWDGAGRTSAWSAPAWWEMGLLEPADWKASWIEPDLPEDVKTSGPAPMLRHEFKAKGGVERARAYVTSHGLYEMQLNGQRVGDQVFTPGWTSYNKRLQYQTYDVTSLIKKGDNALGVMLGNGWYRGFLAWQDRRNIYGDRLALLCQIKITYKDGREEIVGTDGSWKAATSPILMSEIYHGETYDARLEKAGWATAGFADGGWSKVKVADHRKDDLIAPEGPPVRRIEELRPVKVLKTPAGETVVDLGQNMVGWVRLKAQGPAGTTITLRHAEVLDKAGNFYTENLRAAKTTMQYTMKGGGPETFEPHFTFFGFRYVAVAGYPGEVTPESLTGVVVHSDMARTSEFETSKPLVNQLQHNIIWGQKGNFLDVPTDCPQRDERLGWTGDAQAFSLTAAFNMDVASFFTKWLKDVAADQFASGSVPHVVPNVLSDFEGQSPGGAAGWADAAVIIPWNMYLSYGDKRVLETQYDSMVKWVGYQKKRAGDDYIWDGDLHFGDWLAFASNASDYPGATTGKDLIATAFFAHSTDLLRRAALVLGKKDDAARYGEQLGRIKSAFRREFVTETRPGGRGHADRLRPRPAVRPAAGGPATRGREEAGPGGPYAQAPDHGLPRHAVPVPRAQPLRLSRRGLPPAQSRGLSVVALPGEAGRHHDLGALGRPEAGRHVPGRGDELVQPLRLWRDRRLDVSRDGGHRDRRSRPRLQAHPHPAASRGRVHGRQGQPPDAVRKGRVRLDAQGRDLRASRWRSRRTRAPPSGSRRRSWPASRKGASRWPASPASAGRSRTATPSSWRSARALIVSPIPAGTDDADLAARRGVGGA